MKTLVLTSVLMLSSASSFCQVSNTATMDSADYAVKGKVTFEGYVDTYYAYNFNKPAGNDIPYFVSMARHNEVNINLAFVDLKYSSQRLRARIVPGFGSYVNANYANETGTLKNLIEANVGVRLFKGKEIWLDAGVLGSPYTNESALSKDHLVYTRSLAAENVPYYLSGVKATIPVSSKVAAYLYLLNGWQQILDQNSSKAFGSQLEYRPTKNLLINWNTYVGKERVAVDSTEGVRYFSDVYLICKLNRMTLTSCLYYGVQEHIETNYDWWQANVISRYDFSSVLSASLRLEYFSDRNAVLIVPVTNAGQYQTYGGSVGINIQLESNVLFRTEARQLWSPDQIYLDHGDPSSKSFTLTASLCAWF